MKGVHAPTRKTLRDRMERIHVFSRRPLRRYMRADRAVDIASECGQLNNTVEEEEEEEEEAEEDGAEEEEAESS